MLLSLGIMLLILSGCNLLNTEISILVTGKHTKIETDTDISYISTGDMNIPVVNTDSKEVFYVESYEEQYVTTKDIWMFIKEGQQLDVTVNNNNRIINVLNVTDE